MVVTIFFEALNNNPLLSSFPDRRDPILLVATDALAIESLQVVVYVELRTFDIGLPLLVALRPFLGTTCVPWRGLSQARGKQIKSATA